MIDIAAFWTTMITMNSAYFQSNPKVLAHRGDSACYPENTLPAFLSAKELGVDVIETDVHLSSDGKVIIWHDDTLDRETNGTGMVEHYTMQELLTLDAGYNFTRDNGKSFPFRGKGVTMLPFEEALTALPDMRFNVDLKTADTALADAFIDIVRAHHAQERVLCASFHVSNLIYVRRVSPEIATSMASEEIKPLLLRQKLHLPIRRKDIPGDAFQVPVRQGAIKVITSGFIRTFHRLGIPIHVWTINERAEMSRLLQMGVDGIFTDDPRLLLDVVREIDSDSHIKESS